MKTMFHTMLPALLALTTLGSLPAFGQTRVETPGSTPIHHILRQNAAGAVRTIQAGQTYRVKVGQFQDASRRWVPMWRNIIKINGTVKQRGQIVAASVELGAEYYETTAPVVRRPAPPRHVKPPVVKRPIVHPGHTPSRPVSPAPGKTPAPAKSTTPVAARPAAEPFGVYVVGGYNEIIVCQKSVVEAAQCRSLVGWGLDTKTVKQSGASFKMILGPFKTAAEARKAYDANLIPNTMRVKPYALGTCAKFRFDGKEHDINNALSFLPW